MKPKFRLIGALAAVAAISLPVAANAAPPAPQPVVTNLGTPLHIAFAPNGTLYVADADQGAIKVDLSKGTRSVLANPGFVPGIAVQGNSVLITSTGEPAPGATQGPTLLSTIKPNGTVSKPVDLLAFELANNPDGQPQQTGRNADAIANPYAVLTLSGRTLVADAAANDILEVSNNGSIRVVSVLPVIKTGVCANETNNGVPNGGCDPVPTDLALGPDGYLYVTGLGGDFGGGNIYKIDLRTGAIVSTFSGFPPLTGIAVGSDGTIYASSLFTNTIFRVAKTGAVTGTASVPGPTGLAIHKRTLYAGSASLSGNGAVYKVPADSFS